MATIDLNWDNSAVNASANATGQRASKRVKAVGGGYDTTGFLPVNDLPKSASTTVATILANRVYEFKVEALCVVGGPTINNNGVKEGMVFECINPTLESDNESVTVNIDLTNTDITKARLVLKKASDDSIISTVTVNNVGNAIDHVFLGLDEFEDYYLTVEFYADVDGVEVISSSATYLNAVCGGNVANYQISTVGTGNITFQNLTAGSQIDGTAPNAWFGLVVPFPVTAGNSHIGTHEGYTGALAVNATTDVDCRVEIYINAALYQCFGQVGTGPQVYNFGGVVFAPTDTVLIVLTAGDVCP